MNIQGETVLSSKNMAHRMIFENVRGETVKRFQKMMHILIFGNILMENFKMVKKKYGAQIDFWHYS